MRRRSPSYSPPRRGYGRDRSPQRGRFGGYKDAPCGLLVRNIPKGSRPEDLREPFEQFGRVRDVYLPRDYYTGEPRGFGFVQYLNPFDAAEAKKYMDRRMFHGREITVVFAEENRKKPEEMRMKERSRGRTSYAGRRSPYRGYTPSRSPPRYRSPSPRKAHYSRSNDGTSRRGRYESMTPPGERGHSSISPGAHKRGRDFSPDQFRDASPTLDGRENTDRKHRRRSASVERSRSRDGHTTPPIKMNSSPSPLPQRYSRSPGRDSKSRSKSPDSRSPPPRRQRHASSSRSPSRSHSPPPKRQRYSGQRSNSRDADPGQKSYSSLTPEERSPQKGSLSPRQS